MKNDIVNGFQGPPGAAASNTENSRQEAQKSQNEKLLLACPPEPWRRRMPFALCRGHSVSVNPPNQFGFKAGSPRRSRCGEGGSNQVKPILLLKLADNLMQIPYNEHLMY